MVIDLIKIGLLFLARGGPAWQCWTSRHGSPQWPPDLPSPRHLSPGTQMCSILQAECRGGVLSVMQCLSVVRVSPICLAQDHLARSSRREHGQTVWEWEMWVWECTSRLHSHFWMSLLLCPLFKVPLIFCLFVLHNCWLVHGFSWGAVGASRWRKD